MGRKKKTRLKKPLPKLPGIGSGRLPGSLGKTTLELKARLEELDCDPLLFSARILNGDETPQSHPALIPFRKHLKVIRRLRNQISKYTAKAPPTDLIDDLADAITDMDAEMNILLGPNTWIDPKLQVKIALDLLNYMFPKLQAIQNINTSIDPNTPSDQLTDQALIDLTLKVAGTPDGKKELKKLKRVIDNDKV